MRTDDSRDDLASGSTRLGPVPGYLPITEPLQVLHAGDECPSYDDGRGHNRHGYESLVRQFLRRVSPLRVREARTRRSSAVLSWNFRTTDDRASTNVLTPPCTYLVCERGGQMASRIVLDGDFPTYYPSTPDAATGVAVPPRRDYR